MRKILNKQEIEHKKERNKRLLVIFFAVILLFSTFAYFVGESMGNTSKKQVFNGITFEQDDSGYWKFSFNALNYKVLYNPNITSNANISFKLDKTISEYWSKPLYFALDKNYDFSATAAQEIINNIGNIVEPPVYRAACIDAECTEDYPLKNCNQNNIIVFKKSEVNSIYNKDNCTYIEYQSGYEEILSDAFLFKIIGLN